MLFAEASVRCKLLKPRGGRLLKAVHGGKSSPTSFGAKYFGAGVCEIRSIAACRRAVLPSLSSDGVEIVKEVPTPVGISTGGPWTSSHKRLR